MKSKVLLIFIITTSVLWPGHAASNIGTNKIELWALKKLQSSKKLKKLLLKPEFTYGPYQVGPGAPVIAKVFIGLKRKSVLIKNERFILEELDLGRRGGFYLGLGSSIFSYWNIKVLFSEKLLTKIKNQSFILNALLQNEAPISYSRIEISHYNGSDLIAGIETPKYLLGFYNLALRSNIITKRIGKISFHLTNEKYVEIKNIQSSELLTRFFSELYGIDQNHYYNETHQITSNSFQLPFPKEKNFQDLNYVLKTIAFKKQNILNPSKILVTPKLSKEINQLKMASLFGIISKKWKTKIYHSNKDSIKSFSYMGEKSSWNSIFRNETHSLFIGVIGNLKNCYAMINVETKDSHASKNERKIYKENYGFPLKRSDKRNINLSKQIYINSLGIQKITNLSCNEKNHSIILKRLKNHLRKKLHEYTLGIFLNYLKKNLSKNNYQVFRFLNIKDKLTIKSRSGELSVNDKLDNLKLNFIYQN